MSTEKWRGGSLTSLAWANAFTSATLNSIANGNAILSDVQVDNSTTLDIFADVNIQLASAAFAVPNTVGVYLYPLNADGTTYGDGRFSTSAAGPPAGTYLVGSISVVAATQVQEGTVRAIVIPPGKFKFVLYNNAGVAFAGSGNTCSYRTYNRQIV